jgi:hypothetical protein
MTRNRTERTAASDPLQTVAMVNKSRNLHSAETPTIYGENALFDPRARARDKAGRR